MKQQYDIYLFYLSIYINITQLNYVFAGDEDNNDGRTLNNKEIVKESEAQDGEYLPI